MRSVCTMGNKGKCKFCGEEKDLIKAHIIPRNFYIGRKTEKYISVDAQTGKWTHCQSGIYDKSILCSDCDGKFLKLFDDEAYKVLLNSEYLIPIKATSTSKLFALESNQFNYKLLRKFFISVLWRASVSKLEDFQYISLGKYENIALEILKDINEYDNLFKILVLKSPDKSKYSGIVYIKHGRFYGIHVYRIVLGKFEIVVLPNCSNLTSNIYNLYDKFFMSKEKLYILEDKKIYQEKIKKLLLYAKNWQ